MSAERLDLRDAYLRLRTDDERRGYLEAAMDTMTDLPDGAFVGVMEEILGEDWVEELERLGLARREER